MGRIMVVDDEPDMRMALRLFLERCGHDVQEASNGEEALANLKDSLPDLVLMDMRMPGMDGLQTLGKIRETHKELPVIMVTGFGSMDSAGEALQKGANSYVSKPFKHEELIEAMAKVGLSTAPPSESLASFGGENSGLRGAAVGLFVLALASFGWVWHKGYLVSRDYTLPYSNPTDMAWKDGRIYVADWLSQSVYVHDARRHTLPVVKTYFVPDIHISGLAINGDRLYASDSWAHKIYRYKMDDQLTLEATLPSPGPSPTSLFCDGKYLWSVDSKLGKIYQHRLDDNLTLVAQYNSPGNSPVGFYKDEKYAWCSDSVTRRLYRLRLDDQLTPLASYSLEDLEQRQEPLSCFHWAGSNLWFARDRLNKMFRRDGNWLRPVPLGK